MITDLHSFLLLIQHSISICGVLVIFGGVIAALVRYCMYTLGFYHHEFDINKIRLGLAQILTLGLEFIVAADLIGTTTAPDYYTVGIVASIVVIRTFLSFTLNREMNSLRKLEGQTV